VSEFVDPIGVVTNTFLDVRLAPFVIAQFPVTVVDVDAIPVHVTPGPEMVIAVAPLRLLPATLTATVVLCVPEIGVIEVIVAPCTVNVGAPIVGVVPPGVVTLTVLEVSPALVVITQLAFTVVEFDVRTEQVTPVPETVIAVAPNRLVPVRVNATVEPRTAAVGEIDVNVGTGGLTVNGLVPLVPLGVVTDTVPAPSVALAEMVSVVVREVPPPFTARAP
jgi:hypothetical protein